MTHLLRSILLALSLALTACGSERPCSIFEGPALWTGKCEQGLAQGDGLATFEDSYIATLKGHFVDGVPNGEVAIIYSQGGSYHGEMKDGEYNGLGIDIESWGEGFEGYWVDGFEEGEGVRIEERTDPNGNRHDERAQGRFSDREFRGYGEQMIESHFANERYVARLNYPSDIGNGGNGTIGYSDGDLFEGNIDAWGTPVDGVCELASIDYSGPCVARSHKTSDFSGVTCFVSPKEEKKCLKEISSWVS